MAITFDNTSDPAKEAKAIAGRLIEKYHAGLKDSGATIECIEATRADAEGEIVGGSATKINGFSVPAKIKINSLADRVEGKADVTITFDHTQWKDASDDERAAIIDHQLQCVDVMREDGKGAVLTDDIDRPRMKVRKPDHFHRWFDVIAERHKTASIELRQAKTWFDSAGQGWFSYLPFDNEPAKKPPSAEKALEKAINRIQGEPNI